MRTNEEMVKQRCCEILNRQNEKTSDKHSIIEKNSDESDEMVCINSSCPLNDISYDSKINYNQQYEGLSVQIETLLSNEVQIENCQNV